MTGERAKQPPTILALGSFQGDDQAAWCTIDRLQQEGAYSGKCVRVKSPWDVVPYILEDADVIVLDACRTGAVAGTVHRVAARDLPSFQGIKTSTHGGSLPEALELCSALGYDVSRVSVLAVELETVESGAAMSRAVHVGVEKLAQEICEKWSSNQPADA